MGCDRCSDGLTPAVEDRNSEGAREAALDVAIATLDLQLPYRPPAEIELARLDVLAHQLSVDTGSHESDPGHVAGDVATLSWIFERIVHTFDDASATDIEAQLAELRAAAEDEDVEAGGGRRPAASGRARRRWLADACGRHARGASLVPRSTQLHPGHPSRPLSRHAVPVDRALPAQNRSAISRAARAAPSVSTGR